jgi:hypothetical protein
VKRLLRRFPGSRLSDDDVNEMIEAARADILVALGRTLDDDGGLAQIYAARGQQVPVQAAPGPGSGDEGWQVQAVCDRIGLLEMALDEAGKSGTVSGLGGLYLAAARQFLFELRTGLISRNITAEDAFRLLTSVRRNLDEAAQALSAEHSRAPSQLFPDQISDLGDFADDLTRQLDVVEDSVMQLFGNSDDPALIPAPIH